MRTSFILLLSLLAAPILHADEPNYCHDPAANEEWQQILEKYPGDPLFIKLFALRTGLCVMVDHDLITVEQATRIFEQEREQAIIERKQTEQQRSPEYET